MSGAVLRLSATCAALAFLAGCGSSSGGGGSTGGGGNTPTAVTFTFSVGTPTVVAAKIGSGSFTAQSLNSGKLSLSLPNGTSNFAVAYLCTAPSFPIFQDVFEANTTDGSSFILPCPAPSSTIPMGTLTGSVDGSAIPEANSLGLAVANGNNGFVAGVSQDTNFSFNVPAGNDRVEVLAYNSVSSGSVVTSSLVAARTLLNQAVPGALNGGSTVVLGAADETTLKPITYSNVPSGYSAPSTVVDLIMNGAGGFSIASPMTTQYPALPAGAVQQGDFYEFFATATNRVNSGEMAIVAQSSTAAGPVSFTFPSPWTYGGPAPAALPTFNFAYTGFSGKTRVFQTALADWDAPTVGFIEFQVTTSANYLNGSTAVAFPDLSGVPGFVAPPPSGTQVNWVALIAQSNVGAPQPMPTDATISTLENAGAYTVP